MHTKILTSLSTLLVLAAPAAANLNPGSIMTRDGAEITPTLQTGISSNSNFFSTPDDEDTRLIWTVTPKIKAVIEDGPDSYKLDLRTSSALHNKDTVDNYTQVNIGTAIQKEFTSQHRLDFSAGVDWLYESRGRGLTEGLGDAVSELVKYQLQNGEVHYEYGASSSKAQIALDLGFFSKKYQNFREVSQYRDYDKSLIGATGYYNTQAATRTFIEFKQENYRYDVLEEDGVSRDSDDLKALIGIEWEATALTSGSFKLGYQNKNFDDSERESFSGLSWEAAVNWKPLSYSTFQLITSRAAKDPLVQGDYIKESVLGVNWTHYWSDYLSSFASVDYVDEQYTGDVGRKDKTKSLRLGGNYVSNNFGMISTFVDFIDKSSTQSSIEFDRIIVGINFTFALKAN
tara:strand:- start:826 stop:2028 length:1203 start_codon:yes stop_codon:yes gene_type:complete